MLPEATAKGGYMIRVSLPMIAAALVLAGCAQDVPAPDRKIILDAGPRTMADIPAGGALIDKRDLSRTDLGVRSVATQALRPGHVQDVFRNGSVRRDLANGDFSVTITEDELFLHPGSKILPQNMPKITRLSALMLRDPGTVLDIVSHYHSDGLPAKALAESQKRGVAIQAALASRGVPASRIRVVGAGDGSPQASNFDPLGQKMNRRIDLIFRQ